MSAIAAYEKSIELLAQASPKLLDHLSKNEVEAPEIKLDQEIEFQHHDTISKVTLKKKTAETQVDETEKGQKVQQGLEKLAEKMVEQHEHVEPQKPAVTPEVSLLDEYPEEETVNDPVSNEKVDEQSLEKTEATAVKKRVTKKKS